MNFHEDFVVKSSPTGSNYICNPPVTTTDIDTVFLCKNAIFHIIDGMSVGGTYAEALTEAGWTPCVGEGYEVLGGDFTAWRKGNKNYICTTDSNYYNKYVKATKICKMMNLLHKADRIFMFKLVMDGTGLPSTQTTDAFYESLLAPIGNAPVPTPVPVDSTLQYYTANWTTEWAPQWVPVNADTETENTND